MCGHHIIVRKFERVLFILIRSDKMQQYAFGHVGGRLLLRYYDLYQRLHLQFYVLLITGAMNTRNM